jgi:hypothetical protein
MINSDLDIMIDLETLATSPDATVLTIGAIRFNKDKDYNHVTDPFSMDYFYCRVDTESQPNREINDDTLAWWAQQTPEVRDEAFCETDRLSLSDAMTAFNFWARTGERYWANGAAFDFPILESCNRSLGFTSPWRYWQAMDARTIFKLIPNDMIADANLHHALHDCLFQIKKLNYCLSKL